MTIRTFDWVPSTHEEQNRKYGLVTLDCYSAGRTRTAIKRTQPLNLDQGSQGACTGFGLAHALASTPNGQITLTANDAFDLYYQARREDEWTGEDYDGSSVNGAMHAGRTLGRLKSWRWVKTPAELKHALSYHGSVESGSVWLDGMWDTDPRGYIHSIGNVVGGHAYCISGFRRALYRSAPTAVDYWIDNSWGPSWGIDGGAWITDDDAHKIWFDPNNEGELALPIK